MVSPKIKQSTKIEGAYEDILPFNPRRYQICSLKKTAMMQAEIAKEIGADPSIVRRELKRKMGKRIQTEAGTGEGLAAESGCN